jgi:hypothetical protein
LCAPPFFPFFILALHSRSHSLSALAALNVLNNDSDVLLVYNTILSILLLLPLIFLTGEVSIMMEDPSEAPV